MGSKKLNQREELIKFFNDKSSYPYKAKTVKHIQTHSSDVFIVPPYVYKVKKPINLQFLDFSTLSKRRYFCEREVELNRRLTNDVYLGVESIIRKNGKLAFGSEGNVVEYAVKMKRMPEKYFIKNLLNKGQVKKSDILKVIKKLVSFYTDQKENEEIWEYGKYKNIKYTIDENSRLAKKFIGKTITKQCYDTINLYNRLFFNQKSNLFEIRIKEGFIKDCHGDLHLEHINLAPNELNIYDCIEFNNRFRYIDIASDLAFLAMDFDLNGYYKYSDLLILDFTKKIKDQTIFEMIDFYKCYRAYVRGKVESIRSESRNISEEEKNISYIRAKKYFQLALKYCTFGPKPFVIVLFGFIATGKSTIAELLAKELSAIVISSDKVRKEITGTKLTERHFKGFGKGIYSSNNTKKAYTEILNRSIKEINNGNTVILDASFSRKKYRDMVRDKMKKKDIPIFFIETNSPMKTIKKRLRKRGKNKSISDARLEIFEDFKKQYEEPTELNKKMYIKIKTDKSPNLVIGDLFKKLIPID